MTYDDGESYEFVGRVYPSLRAMIKANEYARRLRSPEPYPFLTAYYSTRIIAAALEADETDR